MNKYRIVKHPNGFEPQMLYSSGQSAKQVWFPLNPAGYWLEPDAFNLGNITCHCIFNERPDAERVLMRSRAINEEHIRALHPSVAEPDGEKINSSDAAASPFDHNKQE